MQGSLYKWQFSNAGIWGQSGDRYNGTQSCRFGKTAASYIEMAEDVTDGASMITFPAAYPSYTTFPFLITRQVRFIAVL